MSQKKKLQKQHRKEMRALRAKGSKKPVNNKQHELA